MTDRDRERRDAIQHSIDVMKRRIAIIDAKPSPTNKETIEREMLIDCVGRGERELSPVSGGIRPRESV